eukprot:2932994-Prorocentrum_lima.AAC.1
MTSSLVGSEMCIRDSYLTGTGTGAGSGNSDNDIPPSAGDCPRCCRPGDCLLYTSDAADDM